MKKTFSVRKAAGFLAAISVSAVCCFTGSFAVYAAQPSAAAEEGTIRYEEDVNEDRNTGFKDVSDEKTLSENTPDSNPSEDTGKKDTSESDISEGAASVAVTGSGESSDSKDKEVVTVRHGSFEANYDDRITIDDLEKVLDSSNQVVESYAFLTVDDEKITSNQVKLGSTTDQKDETLVTETKDIDGTEKYRMSGVGTGTVILVPKDRLSDAQNVLGEFKKSEAGSASLTELLRKETIPYAEVSLTVKPAVLDILYLTGQSNMEGYCSSNSDYDMKNTVLCQAGQVYSTYAFRNNDVSKAAISGTVQDDPRAAVVSSFADGTNYEGNQLPYGLDSLTENGKGKSGPDSGIAYRWNQLTGDKVWTVNTAYGGTSINGWIPGGRYYERSKEITDLVQQTYQAEINAGHYLNGQRLMFWLQGEWDPQMPEEEYKNKFLQMENGMKKICGIRATGMISVRARRNSLTADDLYMNGTRLAQYELAYSLDEPDIFMVSNENEQWVSDSGVQKYFKEHYPEGHLTYPVRGGSKTLPSTVKEMHANIHYSQLAHNENGIRAAEGMYAALNGETKITSVEWKNQKFDTVTSLELNVGNVNDSAYVFPYVSPCYAGKNIRTFVMQAGKTVSWNQNTYFLQGVGEGAGYLVASSQNGRLQASVFFRTVRNGVYEVNGKWVYIKNGVVQKGYNGIEQNRNGWWYLKNGEVDFGYTGLAHNENGWWYIRNGKVDFTHSGIEHNSYGWWYVKNGRVDFGHNGVEQNSYGWWKITNGKVNFNFNGLADNANGTWYLTGGKVNFGKNDVVHASYRGTNGWWNVRGGRLQRRTDVAQNRNGWWYIDKNGRVDFGHNGVEQNSRGWWYISSGKVDFSYNGVAYNSKGWWKIRSGKVDFGFTGLADNANGTWYIKGGKVNFDENDVVQASYNGKSGWWNVRGGKLQRRTDVVQNQYGWWYIDKNGRVDFHYNGVEKNSRGWWKITNGKVDFGFTGLAKNANGTWYLSHGKVDFMYNGVYRGTIIRNGRALL